MPAYALARLQVVVSLTQAGSLSVQPYLDGQGHIPTTPAATVPLSANTTALADFVPGAIFQSFKVSLHNSSGSSATSNTVVAISSTYTTKTFAFANVNISAQGLVHF